MIGQRHKLFTRGRYSTHLNSLLCLSIYQGLIGEHEAPMWTEQQSVAYIRHWRGFCGSPEQHTKGVGGDRLED